MAKITIKTASITYERKINLGHFNSATFGGSLWADVEYEGATQEEKDQELAEALEEMQSVLREKIKDEALQLWMTINRSRVRWGMPQKDLEEARIDPKLASVYLAEHVGIDGDGNPIPAVDDPA